jgi:ring-1,2-phenylacetyl-CoA epoxidase subunit PaaC
MNRDQVLLAYVLRLADNALILGQRMIENVAALPELEEELANANFSLDYIGQARMLYSYAGELEGADHNEDYFAFQRHDNEFRNLLLVELANGHFGNAVMRQYLFEVFHYHLLDALTRCADTRLAEIATRAVREVRYHVRHSGQWVVRLGDGTELSHDKIKSALDDAWRFTGEMFAADEVDEKIQREFQGPDLTAIKTLWEHDVAATLGAAKLAVPADGWMMSGGKAGRHSERFGFLIAEMQSLQRGYPGAQW